MVNIDSTRHQYGRGKSEVAMEKETEKQRAGADVGSTTDVSETFAMSQSREQILTMPEKKRELAGDGDPHAADPHAAVVTHPTSYLETMLHIFRGNIGSGLLAMGDAFRNGGLVFGALATVALGVICVHAQHMLLNCAEEVRPDVSDGKAPGYAEAVRLGFLRSASPRVRRQAGIAAGLVTTLLCVTQLGFCCVYIVFIADNIKLICDHYDVRIDLSIHMIFVVVPVLLACMVRNLKFLTPFSTIANVMMAVGVGVVIYQACQDLPSPTTRDYIGSWQQLPLYFGTAVYAFEGIGLVLPLKNEMRHPEQFQKPLGVLNVSMACVGSIFITVGFLGYLRWGDDVQGSLTLNLPPGLIISNVVQILIALAILLTYPLQFHVPVMLLWPAVRRRAGNRALATKERAFRALLVLLTFAVAESIPQLGLFISLVGAASGAALALVVPPLVHLAVAPRHPLQAAKDVLIVALGLCIAVFGTYESLAAIIRAFRQ